MPIINFHNHKFRINKFTEYELKHNILTGNKSS